MLDFMIWSSYNKIRLHCSYLQDIWFENLRCVLPTCFGWNIVKFFLKITAISVLHQCHHIWSNSSYSKARRWSFVKQQGNMQTDILHSISCMKDMIYGQTSFTQRDTWKTITYKHTSFTQQGTWRMIIYRLTSFTQHTQGRWSYSAIYHAFNKTHTIWS
jgi:hypothetical protein